MNKLLRQAAVLGVFLLSACSGSPDTGSTVSGSTSAQNSAKNLGVIRISVTGLGTPNPSATAVNLNDPASGNSKSSSLSTDPCFLQLNPTAVDAGTFSVVTSAPGVTPVVYETYSSFTFQVRNAQGASGTVSGVSCTNDQANSSTLSNITLLGLVDPTATIDGTPFVSLTEFNGTKEPASTALSMLPTHGMQFNAYTDTAQVALGQESLQVFTEAQVDSLTVDTNNGAGSYLLPYGFVVRNVNPALGRTLQANPAAGEYDGQFTFAVKQSNNGNKSTAVYAFVYDLQAVTDSDTRVTQSVEEDNALGDVAANIRAATLGSTDLAVLNDGHVTASNIGDPICTVRTAGTHASPTAYLVPGSGSANTEPTVGSAPYNLQYLATTSAVNVGFCAPMNAAGFSTMVVSGSQSGQRISGGNYTGTYSANTAGNILSFTPGKPFFAGETVSYTLTKGLTSTGSVALSPFTGSFVVATGTSGTASSGTFSITSNPAVGNGPESVAVGDFNGDGYPDLAVANAADGTVSILLGNGSGTFTQASGSPVTVSGAQFVAAGDFNGDGYPDLAVVNDGASVFILLNKGASSPGTFTLSSSPAVGSAGSTFATSVAVGDFNGDGYPDLAVTNASYSGSVSILLNNGTGTFTLSSTTATGIYAQSVAVGDFNGDGYPDLAVANEGSSPSTVSILLNNGSASPGTFTVTSNPVVGGGTQPISVAVGDFNGDGYPDLAVANYGSSTVSILLNKGASSPGTFTDQASPPAAGKNPYSVAVGDFNGDGYPDLAVADSASYGGGNDVSILLNNGASSPGTFTYSSVLAAGPNASTYAVAVGDFNGDGKLDLVTANEGSNPGTVSILTGKP